MIVHDCQQYDESWWSLRRGLPTASKIDKIITPGGKLSAQSSAYAHALIASQVMGNEDEDVIEPSEWMLRGLAMEEEARDWYSLRIGREVEQVGFITDDDRTRGCSPDGAVVNGGVERFVEIKSPKGSTHVGYLLANELPAYYKPQVHAVMAMTERPVTFISYHPSFRPLVVDCEPDAYTQKVSEALDAFVEKLAEMRRKLNV